MKVWVLQTGEPLPIDGGQVRPMRAMNLCSALLEAGHEVVLWSADFDHQQKRHRFGRDRVVQVSDRLQLRLIHSRGYKRHIGIARLLDHIQLSLNLKKNLREINELPDVAFVGFPPIETAVVMSLWLRRKYVPVLLDVKDQWPSLFLDGIPSAAKPFARLILTPYFYWTKRIMREVTCVTGPAQGYLDWTRRFSGRACTNIDKVFHLTTEVGTVSDAEIRSAEKWWDQNQIFATGCTRISFVGSFSSIYDFLPIRDAAYEAERCGEQVQFVICGGGSYEADFQSMMSELSNVVFPGWLDRPKIEALAKRSHAMIAPYKNLENYQSNIPNKIVDAISLGKPVLSPLQGEVAALINSYSVGLIYGDNGSKSLYDNIKMLGDNTALQKAMSENAVRLYADKFQFCTVYSSFVHHLERMSHTAASTE